MNTDDFKVFVSVLKCELSSGGAFFFLLSSSRGALLVNQAECTPGSRSSTLYFRIHPTLRESATVNVPALDDSIE